MGNVFRLTKTNGTWASTSLHDFTGPADGAYPVSKVLIDTHRNLYGSASGRGIINSICPYGCGVVYEVVPP